MYALYFNGLCCIGKERSSASLHCCEYSKHECGTEILTAYTKFKMATSCHSQHCKSHGHYEYSAMESFAQCLDLVQTGLTLSYDIKNNADYIVSFTQNLTKKHCVDKPIHCRTSTKHYPIHAGCPIATLWQLQARTCMQAHENTPINPEHVCVIIILWCNPDPVSILC